tara:strand:+ start:1778 stop:1969 length:192 start_codon:yes stop_codon:yes gene_type:complete
MEEPKIGDLVKWEEYYQVQFVPIHHIYTGVIIFIEDIWAKILTTEGKIEQAFIADLEVIDGSG